METSLINIKNTYAQDQGYDNWESFLNYYGGRHPEWFDQHWQEICIRAQKAALENAAEKGCDSLELFNSEYEILSKAITNPQNLIQ